MRIGTKKVAEAGAGTKALSVVAFLVAIFVGLVVAIIIESFWVFLGFGVLGLLLAFVQYSSRAMYVAAMGVLTDGKITKLETKTRNVRGKTVFRIKVFFDYKVGGATKSAATPWLYFVTQPPYDVDMPIKVCYSSGIAVIIKTIFEVTASGQTKQIYSSEQIYNVRMGSSMRANARATESELLESDFSKSSMRANARAAEGVNIFTGERVNATTGERVVSEPQVLQSTGEAIENDLATSTATDPLARLMQQNQQKMQIIQDKQSAKNQKREDWLRQAGERFDQPVPFSTLGDAGLASTSLRMDEFSTDTLSLDIPSTQVSRTDLPSANLSILPSMANGMDLPSNRPQRESAMLPSQRPRVQVTQIQDTVQTISVISAILKISTFDVRAKLEISSGVFEVENVDEFIKAMTEIGNEAGITSE